MWRQSVRKKITNVFVEFHHFTEAATGGALQKSKNFAIFTGKHLCWGLYADLDFIKKWNQFLSFPVKIAKLLRTPVLKKICERLLLILWKRIDTAEDSSKKFLNRQWKSMGFQFRKLTSLQKKKFKENTYISKQMLGGKLSWKFNFHR